MIADTPPGMPLRAGNLGRVSKDQSGRERSPAEQHADNEAEAGRHGWRIVAWYEDAVSASRFAKKPREDWPRLLADIEAGKLDVVLLWEPARGSRELEDWAGFLRRCRDHHVLIHVFTHHRTYDARIARDWRTLAEDGVDSAYQSEKTSEAVTRALDANASAGLPHGRAHYGYRHAHDPVTGKLTGQQPVPGQAEIAAEIITRIAAAEPVSSVTAGLNARGIPAASGGQWTRKSVRQIALNPAYIGKRYAGGTVSYGHRSGGNLVDAAWPAIVAEETWYAACRVLTDSARVTTRPGAAKYLLSYIMKCAACGGPVCADPAGGTQRPVYRCLTRCVPPVFITSADRYAVAVIRQLCASPVIRDRVIAGNDAQVMEARADAARLRAELDGWAAADISARAYAIREAKILPQIKAAERRAVELSVPAPLRDLTDPARPGGFSRLWESLPGGVAARREIVRLLLAPVTLGGTGGAAEDRITFGDHGTLT